MCSLKVQSPLYCPEEFWDYGEVIYRCGVRAVHARFPMKDGSEVNFMHTLCNYLSKYCCRVLVPKGVFRFEWSFRMEPLVLRRRGGASCR